MKKRIAFLLIFIHLIASTSVFALTGSTTVKYNKSNSALIENKVVGVKADSNGGVWFATSGSGAVYMDASGKMTAYKQADGLKNNFLNAISFDQNGNKYFATNDGVSSLTKDGKFVNYYVNGNKTWAESINTVTADSKGGVWHGVSGYGAYYKDAAGKWTIYDVSNSSLPSNDVKKIVLDNNGGIWFATHLTYDKMGGAAYLDKNGKWTTYTTNNSKLPSNRVYDIHKAKDGSVWMATTGGLAQLKDGNWKVYQNNTYSEYDVRGISEDTKGNIYAATWGHSILMVDTSGKLTNYKASDLSLPNSYLYDLDIDTKGNIWVVSNEGIAKIQMGSVPTSSPTTSTPSPTPAPVQPKEITVYINNQYLNMESSPVIINGSTLVSMRSFLEALRQKVEWVNADKKVVSTGTKTIELKIGESTGLIDGKSSNISEPAKLINNKTMIPLRWIAEALGYKVDWDQTSYIVNISK